MPVATRNPARISLIRGPRTPVSHGRGHWFDPSTGHQSCISTSRVQGSSTQPALHVPKSGMLLPNMGRTAKHAPPPRAASLADALFSTVQQRVLGLLFGHPERSFYISELIQLVGAGSGAVQREIARLEQSGLVTMHRSGAQKHYRANRNSPLFAELRSIARKTVGLAEPLRAALEPLKPQIAASFVYGSVAKRRDTAASDIDLMVLSDTLTYAEVFKVLNPLSTSLGRNVNPSVYSRSEWVKRVKAGNAFASRVLAQPKLWIIGTEHDLPA